MLFIVSYYVHDVPHMRTVSACCESAAIKTTQRFVKVGSSWRAFSAERRTDLTVDIVGGEACCGTCQHESS